jgi:hypothetical protein
MSELMINQIHVWQMVIDLCLVSAILLFSFRWMRGDRAQAMLPRTLELEASLRSLVQEADGAGRHLNDQLMKREQSLQRLLVEIDAADQKLSRTISLGEERQHQIEQESNKALSVIEEVERTLRELKAELSSQATSPAREVYREAPRAQHLSREMRAELSQDRYAQQRENQREQRSHRDLDEPPPPSFERIPSSRYGDEYGHQETRQPQSRQAQSHIKDPQDAEPRHQSGQYQGERAPSGASARPLLAEERNAIPAKSARAHVYQDNMGHKELQQVYAAAETMLKQGKRLEQVSAQTRLPVEEVRLLSQMVEIERNEEGQRTSEQASTLAGRPSGQAQQVDERLGALAGIKRHNATL